MKTIFLNNIFNKISVKKCEFRHIFRKTNNFRYFRKLKKFGNKNKPIIFLKKCFNRLFMGKKNGDMRKTLP